MLNFCMDPIMNLEQIFEFHHLLSNHKKLMPHTNYMWGSPSHGTVRYHVWDWDLWVDSHVQFPAVYVWQEVWLRHVTFKHVDLNWDAWWIEFRSHDIPMTKLKHDLHKFMGFRVPCVNFHGGDPHLLDQILMSWRLSQI
jgi:hypothetical protein